MKPGPIASGTLGYAASLLVLAAALSGCVNTRSDYSRDI
jgi:predicted small secreted protein